MKPADVDQYIAEAPPDRQAALQTVRDLVHEIVPNVVETMNYNMPTFETTDIVCSLASQKHYMALYVCETDLVKHYKEELAHLNCGKSCIRFKQVEDLPLDVIRDIVAKSAENPGFGRG